MLAAQNIKKSTCLILALLLAVIFSALPLTQAAYAANIEIEWTAYSGTGTDELEWNGVAWSPELDKFVAVGEHVGVGTSDLTMRSSDGVSWTPHPEAIAIEWFDVTWSPELGLFVAVSPRDPSTQAVMTSSDGENWTARSTTNTQWRSVTWSPELGVFVAVGFGSPAVMTSPDGVTWTSHAGVGGVLWQDVAWSPDLGLFVAVGETGDRIMTSPDGENWTPRTSPESNPWMGVTWSPELGKFVAVADSGNANRAMISSDGITWVSHETPLSDWEAVTWSPELGVFVAMGEGGPRGTMVSSDGENWTLQPTPNDNTEVTESVVWAAELGKFVAVGTSNRVLVGTPQPTMPSVPLNLQAAAFNDTEVILSWDAAISDNPYSPVTGYKIERSINGDPFATLVANTQTTDTTFQDNDLDPGVTYTYRVSAITTAGTGSPSNQVSVSIASNPDNVASNSLAPTGKDAYFFLAIGAVLAAAGAIVAYCWIRAYTLGKMKT